MNQQELDAINKAISNNLLRMNSFGNTSELTYQLGGNYIRSFDNLWFMPADLTAGLEYTGSELQDVSGYRTDNIAQNTHTASTFLQNEWKNSDVEFPHRGRLDNHNLVNHAIFSPRFNFRYNPTENIISGSPTAKGWCTPGV